MARRPHVTDPIEPSATSDEPSLGAKAEGVLPPDEVQSVQDAQTSRQVPAWRAHAVVFSATAGAFCNLYSMQALFPVLQERFGISVALAGSLLTATTLGLALCAPFAGQVSSRFGARQAVLLALGGLIATTVATAFAYDIPSLIALRLLQGLLIPIALSALLANTTALWPEAKPGALAATYVMGTIIGGVLGRLLPAVFMPVGWAGAFLGFAATQLASGAIVVFLFPQSPLASRTAIPLLQWAREVLPVLRLDIPKLAVGAFALMFSQAAITTYIAIRLASEPFEWGTTGLGALYLVFLPALALVRFTPMSLERKGARWTLAVSIAASWVGLGLTLFENNATVLVGITVFSAAVFVVQTVLAHLLSVTKTRNRDLAGGGYLAMYYAGASCGALLPSGIWQAFGWGGCLALVASVQVIGLFVALRPLGFSENVGD